MGEGAGEGPYGGFYSAEERARLREAGRGLDAEIGAARVALMRALAADEAQGKPEVVLRAVDAVVRAVRARHQMRGDEDAPETDAVLAEMGLGTE